jgi:hypothetical protein
MKTLNKIFHFYSISLYSCTPYNAKHCSRQILELYRCVNGQTYHLWIRVYVRRKFTKHITTVCILIEILMTYVIERLRVLVKETQFLTPCVECNSCECGACSRTVILGRSALPCPDNSTAFREQTCFPSCAARPKENMCMRHKEGKITNKQPREHQRFFPYGLLFDVTS